MALTGSLYIERKSDDDIKMRDFYLRVDDGPEFNLNFGQSMELKLDAGQHHLKVTNRVYSDEVDFSVESGEIVKFEGVNVPKDGPLKMVSVITGTLLYKPILKRI